MTNSKIYFKLGNVNRIKQTIDVNLKIDNVRNKHQIKLYKGNIKIVKINSEENVKEDEKNIVVDVNEGCISINYTVKIGNLGKHGKNGEINNNLITFYGEQVILMPVDILNADDKHLGEYLENISIDYDESIISENNIIPYKDITDKNIISYIPNPKWHNIYEIMKSCYVFSKLTDIQIDKDKKLNIWVEESNTDISSIEISKDITNAINKLCSYYEELFNYKIKNLNIILLSKNKGEYILGGAGRNIIGATFNPNSIRDWQLLSHRLFHAYMDSSITISQMHRAPQLWITEGLATYYENLALESLDESLKIKLNIDSNEEIKRIYRRYLYLRIKDINRLNISPIEESQIQSHGKIEFLHYTQAPLIIKLIEDLNLRFDDKHSIINYLKGVDEKSFSIKGLFEYALKGYCDEFSYRYIFNSSLIQLFNLGSCNSMSEEIIVRELNEYEELLWSWFVKEDEYYTKENISINKLDKLANVSNMLGLKFGADTIEKNTQEFCNIVYKLLKVYLLRIRVCKVNAMDVNIRYRLYKDEENNLCWNKYIDNL